MEHTPSERTPSERTPSIHATVDRECHYINDSNRLDYLLENKFLERDELVKVLRLPNHDSLNYVNVLNEETLGPNHYLYLFHYIETVPIQRSVQHVKGIIVEVRGGHYSIKAWSYPYTPTIVYKGDVDWKLLVQEQYPDFNFEKARLTISEDGTTLRAFYVEINGVKTIYFATHKRINAFKSNWKDNNFGSMLLEVLERRGISLLQVNEHSNLMLTLLHSCCTFLKNFYTPMEVICSGCYHTSNSDMGVPVFTHQPTTPLLSTKLASPRVVKPEEINATLEKLDAYDETGTGIFIFDGIRSVKLVSPFMDIIQSLRGSEPKISYRAIKLYLTSASDYKFFETYYHRHPEVSITVHYLSKMATLLEKIRHHFMVRYHQNHFMMIPKFYHLAISSLAQTTDNPSDGEILEYLQKIHPTYTYEELKNLV